MSRPGIPTLTPHITPHHTQTKEHAIANKKVFTQVQKSFEIAKNSVTFLWSKSTAVCDLWIPPLKNDDGEVEPRGLPAIILLAGVRNSLRVSPSLRAHTHGLLPRFVFDLA
jgi:hypothetical protein